MNMRLSLLIFHSCCVDGYGCVDDYDYETMMMMMMMMIILCDILDALLRYVTYARLYRVNVTPFIFRSRPFIFRPRLLLRWNAHLLRTRSLVTPIYSQTTPITS